MRVDTSVEYQPTVVLWLVWLSRPLFSQRDAIPLPYSRLLTPPFSGIPISLVRSLSCSLGCNDRIGWSVATPTDPHSMLLFDTAIALVDDQVACLVCHSPVARGCDCLRLRGVICGHSTVGQNHPARSHRHYMVHRVISFHGHQVRCIRSSSGRLNLNASPHHHFRREKAAVSE